MKNTVSIFTQKELFEWPGISWEQSLQYYVRVVTLETGDILFREGEKEDKFYILLAGHLKAESDNWDLITTELEPGRAVGETAILTGSPYAATVSALEKCQLLAITRKGFQQVLERHPEIKTFFDEVITPRIYDNYLTTALHQLFGDISDDLNKLIHDHVTWQHLNSGDILFKQGSEGNDLFIVITGRLQVISKQNDQERVVGEVHHGEMVGELALLSDLPRSATVKAVRETDIVRLSRTDFETLVHRYPVALMNIIRIIIRREQSTTKGRQQDTMHSLNFTVLFLDDIRLDFVEALASQLQTDNTVRVFDAEGFSEHYGQAEAAQIQFDSYVSILINRWLNQLEVYYNYLFLVADSSWTNWTVRCLQNADRILIVADSTKSPQLRDIEKQISEQFSNTRIDLILIHPPETQQPSGTIEWLDNRDVHGHYHVRQNDEQQIARIARFITGNAYGLALSGGGATALAHIGVLQALEEQDVPIDMVGGTSMGAIIGAGIATGRDSKEMAALVNEFSSPKKVFDFTLPIVSLLKTQKLTALLQKFFGEVYIEDLWIPYFCVSSNLTKSKAAYHNHGLLWRAVRTSIALPVAIAPMKMGDELHIDGAVMNNYPVDIMFDLIEGGHIIGVMVSPVADVNENIDDLTESVSGWRVLFNRLNPFSQPLQVPAIMNVLFRSLQVNSQYHFQSVNQLADLSIVLHQNYYRFYELEKSGEIIELGYQSSKPQITEWWQSINHSATKQL